MPQESLQREVQKSLAHCLDVINYNGNYITH